MRKLVCLPVLVLLITLAAFPAAALDWGGTVNSRNTGTIKTSAPLSPLFIQENHLGLWLEADFADAGSLLAQASFSFDLGNLAFSSRGIDGWFPRGGDTISMSRDWVVDLDALQYQVRLIDILSLSVGRFGMADFSEYVLDDVLDGLELGLNFPWAVIEAYVGTCAFRFIPNTTIVMSGNDASDASDPDKLLAPPRLVEGVQAVFPELFLRQDLKVSVVLQQDLRAEVIEEGEVLVPDGPADGALHTQYFGVGLSGPLAASFYYDLYGYLQTGTGLAYPEGGIPSVDPWEREFLLGGFGGLELAYYMPAVRQSRIAFAALYSQGMVPISQQTYTLIYSPGLGNLATADLSYSIKPFAGSPRLWLRELQGELTVATYLRTDAFDLLGTPDEVPVYLGTEIDAALNYRPFSDLGMALVVGVYLPYNAAVQLGGRFQFSFSF